MELAAFRKQTGTPAKFVNVAMVANNYGLGDPDDPLSLNVVGFDTAVPALATDFMRD
jgi:60 kDa SS-A/Ro ribonucleoprotein